MTRDRIGKHSKTVNTPKKKGLMSSNLRKNRPMTSGDISIKSKPTRLTINESNYLCVTVRLLGDRNDFVCPCTVSALRKVFASFIFFVRHFI